MSIRPKSGPVAIQNAKTRFGMENGRVFDYESSQYLDAKGNHSTQDGFVFDLAKVAQCINDGQHIEHAIVHGAKTQQIGKTGNEVKRLLELIARKNEEIATLKVMAYGDTEKHGRRQSAKKPG